MLHPWVNEDVVKEAWQVSHWIKTETETDIWNTNDQLFFSHKLSNFIFCDVLLLFVTLLS